MQRVFMIHGWDGNPKNAWFPWVKRNLEKKGFEVVALEMPHPEKPTIEDWVRTLQDGVKDPDEETYFVGHSIGCQTILRYLETLPDGVRVGGCVFVAGFVHLQNLENGESEQIAAPWLGTPLDWNMITQHCEKFSVVLSDNDPFVPVSDADVFKEQLGADVEIHHGKGHFDDEGKVFDLPFVVDELIKMSS